MGKGSLLVTVESMELNHVESNRRDKVVGDFHRMMTEAERNHDKFYAIEELYTHEFSYGDFYSGFLYRPWAEFRTNNVLSSISQMTYQLLIAFRSRVSFISIDNETSFFNLSCPPYAHTGYYSHSYNDYVGNVNGWEKWHREWYKTHPEYIDWNDAKNKLFPRQDLVIKILKRELLKKFKSENLTSEQAEIKLACIDDKDIANEFHDKVMKHKGGDLEGYAFNIGNEICDSNYYTYLDDLSSMENRQVGSLRKIYSIVNKNGKQQFISIDFLHGMFEFHNENGDHLGEYRFDGSLNSGAEKDHRLKCLGQWRKKAR